LKLLQSIETGLPVDILTGTALEHAEKKNVEN
jgi:hypothetical protein